MHHIEIIFNLNNKKEFCFRSLAQKTETFSIVIFWVGGKNCIVKNKKCIAFPKSRYINLNPVLHPGPNFSLHFLLLALIIVHKWYSQIWYCSSLCQFAKCSKPITASKFCFAQSQSFCWQMNSSQIKETRFSRSFKVAYVVKIKLFFMDWFYYNLIILIK